LAEGQYWRGLQLDDEGVFGYNVFAGEAEKDLPEIILKSNYLQHKLPNKR
jgi:hypothetical protein